jgi:hypothetical protein
VTDQKTIPDARQEAEKVEKKISELITAYQKNFSVTVTEVVLKHSYAAKTFPFNTDVEIRVKLK